MQFNSAKNPECFNEREIYNTVVSEVKEKKGIALSASDFSVQRSHPPILIKSCEKVEKLCTSCHSLHELFENSDLPPPQAAHCTVGSELPPLKKSLFNHHLCSKQAKRKNG